LTDIDALCDRHGYPEALRALLDSLKESARAHIPGLRALVLSGSVATGDFVWRGEGSAARLLSDIDAFAFAERAGPVAAFSRAVEKLETSHASPLFHIDVSISAVSALRRLPRRFQFVEAGLAGAVLVGPEVLEAFPKRFDRRAGRQSLFGNPWMVIRNWREDDEVHRLALARIILDLPLIAFSEAGRCIPGHTARVDAFLGLEASHPLATPPAREAVTAALRMRSRGDVPREALEGFAPQGIDALLDFWDGSGPPGLADRRLAARIAKLLPRRTIRRLAGELRAALSAPRPDPGWWLRRKEAVGGAALIGLLRFLRAGAAGPPPPGLSELFGAFAGGAGPTGESEAYMADARRVYREGRRRLYPSTGGR
jgi:hypothetical protein